MSGHIWPGEKKNCKIDITLFILECWIESEIFDKKVQS